MISEAISNDNAVHEQSEDEIRFRSTSPHQTVGGENQKARNVRSHGGERPRLPGISIPLYPAGIPYGKRYSTVRFGIN